MVLCKQGVKRSFLFCLLIGSFLLPFARAELEETGGGNVTLEHDELPFINMTYENYTFVFSFKKYFLRVAPFVIFNNKTYGLKAIIQYIKTNFPNVKYSWLLEKAKAGIHYGFNITALPPSIANKIDFIGFKLVDLNFPKKLLKLVRDSDNNRTYIHIKKANLIFGFDDLLTQGFSVQYFNASYILVGQVKGKTNLIVDPVVLSNDIIRIEGFSEGAECNFHTIYLYDLNGTYELEDLTDYTTTTTFTLDTQVRPADSGALTLTVNLTSIGSGSGYSIEFSGIDFFDAPAYELIVLNSGIGVYVTSTSFKSVNASGVVVTIPSGIGKHAELRIFQNRWGVISELGNSYYLTAVIYLLQNSWFADENKTIEINITPRPYEYILYENNTHFRLGEIFSTGNKRGRFGCHITISTIQVTPSDLIGWSGVSEPDYALIELYDSSFYAVSFRVNIQAKAGAKIYNCKFQNVVLVALQCDLNFLTFHGVTYYQQFGLGYASGNTTNINIYNCYNAFWFYSSNSADVRDCIVRNVTYILRLKNGQTAYPHNLTNIDSDNWLFDFSGGFYPKVWRNYDRSIQGVFPNGTLIQGMNITLSYYGQGGGVVGSWITGANGSTPILTLPYGYYRKGLSNVIQDFNPYFINATYGDYIYSGNFTHSEQGKLIIALHTPYDEIGFFVGIGAGFILAFILVGVIMFVLGWALGGKK